MRPLPGEAARRWRILDSARREYVLFNDLHTRHHTAQIPARVAS
jgi:hypothetical protein